MAKGWQFSRTPRWGQEEENSWLHLVFTVTLCCKLQECIIAGWTKKNIFFLAVLSTNRARLKRRKKNSIYNFTHNTENETEIGNTLIVPATTFLASRPARVCRSVWKRNTWQLKVFFPLQGNLFATELSYGKFRWNNALRAWCVHVPVQFRNI